MNRSRDLIFFGIIFFILLISGCAKISAPSGGPKDRIPPVVVKSTPEHGSINFKGKSISVTFNEYVTLSNINDKFMVSPPMKKLPKVFTRGKSVNIEFEEELKDSTTYTFYFQDAIRDLNEGNIINNFQFVISTGSVIDSLSVTGNVYNAYDLEAPESTQVLMYRELADSAVIKHLPYYLTRVDPKGYYRIDNVRGGIYKLYALKDLDNSKNYNLRDEEFAFRDSVIAIISEKNFIPIVKDTSTLLKVPEKVAVPALKQEAVKVVEPVVLKGEYPLFLFTAKKKDHYLTKSSRDFKYQLFYSLSLPPDSMKFEFSIPGTGRDGYFAEKSINNDTVKIWLTDSTLYNQPQITTMVKYPFTDTLGITGYKEDTIIMRFLVPRTPRVATTKKPAFIVDANFNTGTMKPGQKIIFKSQTPLRPPDTSRISLYEIIDAKRRKMPYTFIKDSTNSCKYSMTADLLQGKKYLFIADSAAFSNLYNESSDSTGKTFSVREPDSYSKLTINILNSEGGKIIQLLSREEKLVNETYVRKTGVIVFPLLESGFYRIRAIYDLNGDGKWTTGDFDSGRQPEPVSYYPGEIEMKVGWEAEQDWDLKTKNVKDQKLRKKPK